MKSLEEINELIKGDDLDVLKLCDEFLDARIEKERLRGESAERRANINLGLIGAISAFLVFLASGLLDRENRIQSMLVLIYSASAVWLARSIWYSMKTISLQSRFQIKAETVYEFQKGSQKKVLKKIIAGKLWEYDRSVQPNTQRLFYVQRAQRSLVFVVALLLFLGAYILYINSFEIVDSHCLTFLIFLLLVVYFFIGDWLIEKAGIWNH